LATPVLYWTPIIAPGNLIFYHGKMFPQCKGSALVSGLASRALIRIVVTGATAKGAERWDVGHRIRDVEVGAGRRALDARRHSSGGLFRVTPKGPNRTRRGKSQSRAVRGA
jgi:glucose/arabinose dehydrogenase